MSLAPYDAVCLASYGGPDGPDDVLPFMRNATRGRGVPDERLVEVSEHYRAFGGRSPINARNAELMVALRAELERRDMALPVTIGNRNWHPYFAQRLAELRAQGARRVLCVPTAAYACYSGCRQYRENLAAALAEIGGGLELDMLGPFADTPGFVTANVDAVRAALAQLPAAHVLFVTHSIPSAMEVASDGELGSYVRQHQRVIAKVWAQVPEMGAHELVYCSRSGAPHIPWLEPDINDRLAALAAAGIRSVIAVPIGFINDHMEVVYDLDTQARDTALELGISYLRAATAGTHPAFVTSLVDAMVDRAAVARGQAHPDGRHYFCPDGSCLSHPGATQLPAIG